MFALKMIRKRRGLTQEDLANLVGISKGTVSKYETGYLEPNLATLLALSRVLNVSIDYLLGNEPPNVLEEDDDDGESYDEHEDLILLYCSAPDGIQNAIFEILEPYRPPEHDPDPMNEKK